jgi:hypothetical protein
MIKITNNLELNDFFKTELKKENFQKSHFLEINCCDIPENQLIKHLKYCFDFYSEKSLFNKYIIHSHLNNNLIEIKKEIAEVNSKENKITYHVFVVSLTEDEINSLNIKENNNHLILVNIEKYNPEIIPSILERIFSGIVLSIPVDYLIYKYFNTIKDFIKNIFGSFSLLFKILTSDFSFILITTSINFLSALLIVPVLIYWMFKAFALRIKGLLSLSSTLLILNLIILFYLDTRVFSLPAFQPVNSLDYIFMFLFIIFSPIITFIYYLTGFKIDEKDSLIDKIITGESNIQDPITYFKNKKKNKSIK